MDKTHPHPSQLLKRNAWLGLAVPGGLVLSIEGSRWLGVDVLDPVAFLLGSVVYASFVGGTRAGLGSAVLTWAYVLYFFVAHGAPPVLGAHDMADVLAYTAMAPATAVLVGRLKQRSERQAREHAEYLTRANEALRQEVAEREQAERCSRDAEARYRAITDLGTDFAIAYRMDPDAGDARIEWASETFTDITGYTTTEMQALGGWMGLIHPDDTDRASQHRLQANGGHPIELEARIVRKDGAVRWLHLRTRPEWDSAHARVERVYLTAQDITERKMAEAEVRRERDFAESLIETAQAIVLVLDPQGRVVRFNPYTEELSGHRLEEVRGRDWFSTFLPERDRDRIRQVFLQAVGDTPTRGNVNPIVTKNGDERLIEWYDKTLKDDGGAVTGLIAIGQDITERERSEASLRRRGRILEAIGFAAERLLASANWEANLREVLARLGDAAEVSRVYIFENHPGPASALLTSQRHEWAAPGITPQIDNPELQNMDYHGAGFGRWVEVLSRGDIVRGPVRDFPAAERLVLTAQGIRSLVAVPIVVDAGWWGFIGFDDCRTEREWSAAVIEALKTAARALGAAFERRRVDEALRAAEARYRAVAELSTDFALAYRYGADGSGRREWMTEAFTAITGYGSEELDALGGWPALLHPDDRPAAMRVHEEVMRGQPAEAEVRIRPKGGGTRWVHVRLRSEWNPAAGRVSRVTLAAEDITARKEAELEHAVLIREQAARTEAELAQQRLGFLADASASLASSLDYAATLQHVAQLAVPVLADWCLLELLGEDGTLRPSAIAHRDPERVEWARAVLERYPHRPAQPIGVTELILSGRTFVAPEISERLLAAEAHDDTHLEYLRLAGLVSAMVVPLKLRAKVLGALFFLSAESGRRYGPADQALAEDLARHASLAIENAHLYREAQEAVRAREQFLSMASHEIRTPLTVIQGFLEGLSLMAERAPVGSDASTVPLDRTRLTGLLSKMDRSTKRLGRLIDQLLDVSRMQTGQLTVTPAPMSLDELLASVLEDARQKQETGQYNPEIRLRLDAFPGREVRGNWDRGRLEQVLANLLDNAFKYSPAGGSVTVRLSTERADGPPGPGQLAHLVLSDEGIGVPPEDQARVFEPFARASNAAERRLPGMGMGLAVCKQIVELHKGQIWLESGGADRGTAFHILLPMPDPGAQAR